MSARPPLRFAERYRRDLMGAAHRPSRPRARSFRVGLAALAAAIVAALVVTQLHGERAASAGVDIKLRDGHIEVRLTDLEHRPGVIESAVRKAGIDLAVTAAPVGPSLVGKFVTAVSTAPLADVVQPVDVDGLGNFGGFDVPEHWPGRLELVVGRPAARGEAYARASDAFALGEPLHCSSLLGLTAADAAARLPAPVERFRFRAIDPDSLAAIELTPAQLADSPYSSLRIAGGQAVSDHDVILTLTGDGRPIAPGPTTTSPCRPR